MSDFNHMALAQMWIDPYGQYPIKDEKVPIPLFIQLKQPNSSRPWVSIPRGPLFNKWLLPLPWPTVP